MPIHPEGISENWRADYTIEVLQFNRGVLLVAREEAFRSYRSRVNEYITRKSNGASAAELRNLIWAIQRMGHQTVWEEMKRQHSLMAVLITLFSQAPEALTW